MKKYIWMSSAAVVIGALRVSLLNFAQKDHIFSCSRLYKNISSNNKVENRDILQLFFTCIRTERVRKMFIIFSILNEFSCGNI